MNITKKTNKRKRGGNKKEQYKNIKGIKRSIVKGNRMTKTNIPKGKHICNDVLNFTHTYTRIYF